MDHILSVVLFTPLVGLLVLLFIPASNPRAVKLWANAASFIGFLVSLRYPLGTAPPADVRAVDLSG